MLKINMTLHMIMPGLDIKRDVIAKIDLKKRLRQQVYRKLIENRPIEK